MARQDWFEVVEQYKHSGLTQRAFAEQHHLPMSTLQCWLKRARNPLRPVAAQMLPVRVVDASPSPSFLELEVGSARLRFAVGTDTSYLALLIRALAS
jgi:hypothetical protein